MNKTYELNRKRMIIYLLVFVVSSSIITYLSIESTMKYKIALDQYDESIKKGDFTFDNVNILEKMNYDRDSQRYSLRLMMTIIICGLEFLILYIYFLRNNKLVVDKEGIKLYGLYKRKAIAIYTWDIIDSIDFQYADGIRGLASGYGIKLHMIKNNEIAPEIFIPIERFQNYNEILEDVSQKYSDVQIKPMYDTKKEDISFIKLLKEAYLQFREQFGSFMAYSLIIFIFAFLNTFFNKPPVNLIAAIANIYFGYRAKIAMNFKAYMSYEGEKIDFDTGWKHSKHKLGRYFGAELLMGIIPGIFIFIGAIALMSNLRISYKILMSIILGLGCLLSISRLYFIPYIASIIDTSDSYMELNGMLIKKHYKKVLLVISLLGLQVIPMISIVILNHEDIDTIRMLVTRLTYINVMLGLFISPYMSTLIMNLLRGELPISTGGCHNENE